ncbi:hypothetical protein OURE66S_02591 [Oligella ureolytica]
MIRNSTEALIKEILVSHLLDIEKHDPVFIYEMNIARFTCRADVVVANGHLSVYEIKSAADNLDRLPKQLEIYKQHFEKVVVVCAPERFSGVQALVGPEVGISIIDADGKLKKHKRGRLALVSKEKWLSFLPVDILRTLLRNHELRCTGDRNTLLNLALDKLSEKSIREYVLDFMKVRHLRIDKIKHAQEESRKARREFEEKINKSSEWLQDYSDIEVLKAIPRKVN